MSFAAASIGGIVRGDELSQHRASSATVGWSLDALAGRSAELYSGPSSAGLTLIAGMVFEVQLEGGIAVWVSDRRSLFFPPDFSAIGIDLRAVPVIQVNSMRETARVADMLLRSGAFRLVVLDMHSDKDFTLPMQTRLSGLAKANNTALVRLLPPSRDVRRGSLVSLRIETEKHRIGHDGFACSLRAVKDKQRSPGWAHTELYCGTDGLC